MCQIESKNEPSSYEDYSITATYFTEEKEFWDEHIGEVCLPKELPYDRMPLELKIKGVTYVRK